MSFKTKAIGAVCAGCVAASGYVFSVRSINNLNETRPELRRLSECALSRSPVDFVIIDGGRTAEEHLVNVRNGKSWIKKSRHQEGAAIDVATIINGKITYIAAPYAAIAEVFKYCSYELNIPIVWGGDWKVQDLMHFELDRRFYP